MTKSMVRRARLCESVCVMYRSIRGILPDNRPNLPSESLLVKLTFERLTTILYCLILNCLCVSCLVWCFSAETHQKIILKSGNRSELNSVPCTSLIKALVKPIPLCGDHACEYFWYVARTDTTATATSMYNFF